MRNRHANRKRLLTTEFKFKKNSLAHPSIFLLAHKVVQLIKRHRPAVKLQNAHFFEKNLVSTYCHCRDTFFKPKKICPIWNGAWALSFQHAFLKVSSKLKRYYCPIKNFVIIEVHIIIWKINRSFGLKLINL